MFSPRLLAVLALIAAVGALPTDKPVPRPVTTITEDDVDDSPWFSFPLFGNLFAPLWRLLPSFGEIGPKIVADDNKFQVVVNVKDYKKDDLKVKVKNDFIFVQGSHEAKHDDHDVFASQFFHTYTLPVNSSGSDVTAEISPDGYLVVTAPLNGPNERAKDLDREVPITESATPYLKEDKTKVEKPEAPPVSVPVSAAEDDRKEPTTPSDREDITEKDNDIPHGNEINP
ncbi:alpha-crystallin A chain-like [Pectinophora gossypiella]|uniref:alpha-crystallin A chain-like n=1 Tax=Pectinophora gossypiella TaxID=13191 RepID=UPI00214E9E6B|nr:alpha-crystallin A chain-like [Pectinophora gossypiella]